MAGLMIAIANSTSSNYVASAGGGFDPDAEAFITATGLTTPTQQNAINELVLDLKGANIWTKFNALYPMITDKVAQVDIANQMKFNLKNPLDTDAAFRLNWVGGWVWSTNGATPNGTNAYANTFLTTSTIGLNSGHYSFYSRTNNTTQSSDMGTARQTPDSYSYLFTYITGALRDYRYNDGPSLTRASGITSTQGLFLTSRTASNVIKGYRNGSTEISGNAASNVTSTFSFYLGSYNFMGSATSYSNRQLAFSSIGSGLTDLESQLFYQIVEKYQVSLSRNINPTQSFYYNRNYGNETNAYLFATQITNTSTQVAIGTFIGELKSYNIWTKMRAVYPMITDKTLQVDMANQMKYNLVNPQDTNDAFRLSWVGGWTYSTSGAKPNGSNAYALTYLTTPATQFSGSSIHLSYYNVTNSGGGTTYPNAKTEIGAGSTNKFAGLFVGSGANLNAGGTLGGLLSANLDLGSSADPRGYVIVSRETLTLLRSYKNGVLLATNTGTSTGLPTTGDFEIGINYFSDGSIQRNNFSDRGAAFVSFGSGLTSTEVSNLTLAVQNLQTTLGRQV